MTTILWLALIVAMIYIINDYRNLRKKSTNQNKRTSQTSTFYSKGMSKKEMLQLEKEVRNELEEDKFLKNWKVVKPRKKDLQLKKLLLDYNYRGKTWEDCIIGYKSELTKDGPVGIKLDNIDAYEIDGWKTLRVKHRKGFKDIMKANIMFETSEQEEAFKKWIYDDGDLHEQFQRW